MSLIIPSNTFAVLEEVISLIEASVALVWTLQEKFDFYSTAEFTSPNMGYSSEKLMGLFSDIAGRVCAWSVASEDASFRCWGTLAQ